MLHTFFIAKEGRKHDGSFKIQKYHAKGRVMHLSEKEQHKSRHFRQTSETYHQRLRYKCLESVWNYIGKKILSKMTCMKIKQTNDKVTGILEQQKAVISNK